ncbi:nitrous oxide-stimulated promoter family protein [Desulfopila inferna]|uniref:nitrous oxide-stimulated promoter family protein n=1 Tax=Desulfopila inferna TaxID=468528 RepID=UPI001962A93F|nr:nitrous oxide-stimulated promoter family protein [Desulfopila inferna]MBM9603086.1 nitrous oxide-stimulated promoter family protein [Desulfopila inferna]
MKKHTSNFQHARLAKEYRTIRAMIKIYCQAHHTSSIDIELCGECLKLRNYAQQRLQNCPFQQNKPTCGNCTIHCYKKEMREQIKTVMKYSGPRMIYRHPIMAFRHLLDGRRKPESAEK